MWCKIGHDVSSLEIAESNALQAMKLMNLGERDSKFEGYELYSMCIYKSFVLCILNNIQRKRLTIKKSPD